MAQRWAFIGHNAITLVGRIASVHPANQRKPLELLVDTPRSSRRNRRNSYENALDVISDRHLVRVRSLHSPLDVEFVTGMWLIVEGTLRYEPKNPEHYTAGNIAVILPKRIRLLRSPGLEVEEEVDIVEEESREMDNNSMKTKERPTDPH